MRNKRKENLNLVSRFVRCFKVSLWNYFLHHMTNVVRPFKVMQHTNMRGKSDIHKQCCTVVIYPVYWYCVSELLLSDTKSGTAFWFCYAQNSGAFLINRYSDYVLISELVNAVGFFSGGPILIFFYIKWWKRRIIRSFITS